MTTPLPAAPSLEQLRKQAKELVRERRAGAEPLRLSEAQRDVAREYGFASWPRLKAYVERVSAHGPGPHARVRGRHRLLRGSRRGLRSVVASGLANGIAVVRAHHPALADASEAEMRAIGAGGRPPRARARARVRELGAVPPPHRRAWPRAASRSGARSRRSRRATARRSPRCSTATRASSRARGTNGNDLLGLAGGRGATTRSCASCSSAAPIRAAPTTAAGRRCTRPATATTSSSRALLLEAGARTDLYGHGEGGTPLAAALFWGNAKVAERARRARESPRATCASPPGSAGST